MGIQSISAATPTMAYLYTSLSRNISPQKKNTIKVNPSSILPELLGLRKPKTEDFINLNSKKLNYAFLSAKPTADEKTLHTDPSF
jgi:hypothetical protein